MASLADWEARITSNGVTYFPPNGRSVGGLHVREHLRPLRAVKDLMTEELLRLGNVLTDIELGELTRLVTEEGEHAAMIELRAKGKEDGAPVLFQFGFVFGDDSYTMLEGWMTDPARFDELTEVMKPAVMRTNLCLGKQRQRWFHYDPPPGWQALGRQQLTEWYPLDFPRHYARIYVAPAFVTKAAPALIETLLSRRMMSFKRESQVSVDTIQYSGFTGVLTQSVGEFEGKDELKATRVVTVALKDASGYVYLMRLETTEPNLAADQAVLFNMVKTIQSVPLGAESARTEAMSWMID